MYIDLCVKRASMMQASKAAVPDVSPHTPGLAQAAPGAGHASFGEQMGNLGHAAMGAVTAPFHELTNLAQNAGSAINKYAPAVMGALSAPAGSLAKAAPIGQVPAAPPRGVVAPEYHNRAPDLDGALSTSGAPHVFNPPPAALPHALPGANNWVPSAAPADDFVTHQRWQNPGLLPPAPVPDTSVGKPIMPPPHL